MNITVYDGVGEIGGNKILIEGSDGSFLLDFGFNFKRWGDYFEEYLNPRTSEILNDLLYLEIIPRIDIYREDLYNPWVRKRFSLKEIERPHFVFISHPHVDHYGMFGLLHKKIPILSSPETVALILAAQEVGKSKDYSSLSGRERRVSMGDTYIRDGLLKATSRKNSRFTRDFISLEDGITAAVFRELSQFEIEQERWPLIRKGDDLPYDVKIYPVYHSVLGARALVAKVDGWYVVYTGDLRMGPEGKEREYWEEVLGSERLSYATSTQRFIEDVKELHPMVLITEGTRVTPDQGHSTGTEKDVYDHSLSVVREYEGRLVISDFPARHLERLLTFLKIAETTGRKLVIFPYDYIFLEMTRILSKGRWLFNKEALSIYYPSKLSYQKIEKNIVYRIKEGEIDIPFTYPEDINKKPGNYILSMGYFDMQNLLDFDPAILREGVYIHSTSEAYTEEQKIDAIRFLNWLELFGIKTYGIERKEGRPFYSREFHASGHISAKELSSLIETLAPEVIIPIHTEHPLLFRELTDRRIIFPKRGEPIYIG